MKVLFAVSNENITTSVISKYQQKYKEIVTSKNVYYFNAIIKELQNDRSYDAIVIGEDLEPISNNNYDVIDKFIIEKLDIISDEASKSSGEDIPIIFICSDRRTKSDQLLRNLFSMGIYNALVGNDRSLDKVCSLINKPRNKKEAKKYYMIDGDDSIEYEPASEELVSEEQLRNILTYYKKIGNDEKKCVQAFESIASQYNNAQLRLIVKVLPMEVKAILETSSPVYQKLMENGTVLSNGKYSPYTLNDPKEPGKLDFIEKDISTNKLTRPVVIPSNLDFSKQKDPTLTNNNTGINSIGIQQKYTNNNRIRNQQINQPNNIQPPKQQYNQYYNAYNNTNQQQYQNQGYTQYQSRYGTISPYNPYNPYNQYNQYYKYNQNNQYNPYSSNNNNLNGIPNGNLQSQFKPTSNNMTTPKNQDKQDRQNSQNIQDIQNSQHVQNNEIDNSENGENKNGISQLQANNIQTNNIQNEVATPVKKRRGRPKKNAEEDYEETSNVVIKKKRGRPRKVEKLENVNEDEIVDKINSFDNKVKETENTRNEEHTQNISENEKSIKDENNIKNGQIEAQKDNTGIDLFNLSIDVPEKNKNNNNNNNNNNNYNNNNNDNNDNDNNDNDNNDNDNNDILNEDKYAFLKSNSNANANKNALDNNYDIANKQLNNKIDDDINKQFNNEVNGDIYSQFNNKSSLINENENNPQNENNNFFIAGNGKIVSFVGASKNGTSFIVNCLALLLANDGIKVAIADFTKNKNSYYLFTDNDSEKVKIAANSLKNLSNGIVDGLKIKNDLYLFTSVPDENVDEKLDKNKILNTLSENFDIVILDCDFKSDSVYFAESDEIYLIQSMDVFTIQPLTKFLSDYKNIIDASKLHIVINKYLKLKKLDYKMVIAGMSKYNDPSMALQRDLFNPKKITYNLIPFDTKTYESYLEAIALCKININEFSNNVIDSLEELKSRVYPLVEQQGANRKRINNQNRMNNNNMNFSNVNTSNVNMYNLNTSNLKKSNVNTQNTNMQNNLSEQNINNSAFSSDINNTLNKMRNNNF